MRSRGPQHVGDVLSQLMARKGLARPETQAELDAVWAAVVGSPLAGVSQPGALRRGQLEIVVGSSTVVQELAFRQGELQEELARRLPQAGIRGLRFRVGRMA